MNLELSINTEKVKNSNEEKLLGATVVRISLVRLMSRICVKRQVKNYMHHTEFVNT